MPLVDDHVKPFDFAKYRPIFNDKLIRCQQDLELAPPNLLLLLFTRVGWTFVDYTLHTRRPFLKFVVPIGESTKAGLESSNTQIAPQFPYLSGTITKNGPGCCFFSIR